MCDCMTDVDSSLKDRNTRLSASFCLTKDLGGMDVLPIIKTEKLDMGSRTKPVTIVPTYCPFCGEKYKRTGEAA